MMDVMLMAFRQGKIAAGNKLLRGCSKLRTGFIPTRCFLGMIDYVLLASDQDPQSSVKRYVAS